MKKRSKYIFCKAYLFFYLLVAGLSFCSLQANAQNIFFNKILPPAGKNFVHITGMAQDKQGYMWFASKNGLFRYDGYQMKQYRNNPLDQNSLSSDGLESICIDKNGIIWLGTFNTGLDRFDPSKGTFTHFKHNSNEPSSLSGDMVSVIFSDKNGTLWLGADCLEQFNPSTNTFIHYRSKPGDSTTISSNVVRAIYEDRQGTLWIGTGSVYGENPEKVNDGGLNKMDRWRSSFTRYMNNPKDPRSLINNKVRAIFEDSKGNFWIGTSGDGLHTMDRATGKFERHLFDPKHPDQLSRPAFKKAPYYDHITFITEDATGAIWIGTSESGINYYDPISKHTTHFENGKDTAGSYTDYTAWCTYTSRDSILWMSSLHGSLYRINPARMSVPFYQVPNRGATAFLTDTSNMLWIATNGSGIITKDAEGRLIKNYKYDPADSKAVGSNEVNCISSDAEGNVWMGVAGRGLTKFDRKNESFINYKYDTSKKPEVEGHDVLCIYPASPDILWIGTVNGLDRLNEKTGQFRHYSFYPKDKSEFGADVITSIFKDSRSVWWASSWQRGGIQRFDPETGKFKTFLKGANVVKIYEDHAKVIWAAGLEGLFRFDRDKDVFIRFDDLGFLSEENKISNLLEDNKGNLWLTTFNGIVRVNPKRDESTLFGKSYGINGNDFYFLAAYKNNEGKLFFGSQSGYYSFFPEEITQKKRAPEITITDFRISNIAMQPGNGSPLTAPLESIQGISLNHNQNTFSFEFVGIDYSNSEDNRHLFMLENYDAGWNLAGAERNAAYFNVPPGKYVFRVKVVNSYGVWAERNITVTITPPWWSTWWFRIGSLLLVAGIFYIIIRWRIRHKFNRQIVQSEKDKQLAELKQKTGELEMQALRAQMNPHFVFNSLNAINRFILENNKTQASEYLTKFSRLVRMILQNSQSTLITLESELESLKLYLELEALRFEGRFEYQVTVPKELDIDILKVPPLIIQPYAENAIWHGLMHKEEKGHLKIDISQQDDYLIFKIKDDGIGRKQSAAMASKSATKHKSMGLQITADRIAMLQRSASKDSPVVINDLENAEGSAAGTEVIIKTPIIYG